MVKMIDFIPVLIFVILGKEAAVLVNSSKDVMRTFFKNCGKIYVTKLTISSSGALNTFTLSCSRPHHIPAAQLTLCPLDSNSSLTLS